MFYKNPISLTRKTNHQPQFSLKVIFSNLFPCLPGNKINVLLHKFPRTNSGWRSIYGKRGIKINVTFSEGSPPELCVIVPIDKRGPWLWKYFHLLYISNVSTFPPRFKMANMIRVVISKLGLNCYKIWMKSKSGFWGYCAIILGFIFHNHHHHTICTVTMNHYHHHHLLIIVACLFNSKPSVLF